VAVGARVPSSSAAVGSVEADRAQRVCARRGSFAGRVPCAHRRGGTRGVPEKSGGRN